MLKFYKYSFIVLSFILMIGCKNKVHFLKDENYRNLVEEQFNKRKELAKHRDSALFSVLKTDISLEKKEALKFLFAFMPLSDLADYDGEFFLNQVNVAFEAKNTFSWGKELPDEIFRHFVLPYRVNNENLDTARSVFFKELKDRLIDLSMYDAALEVNHWCHEKANYKASDGRTSSPLATVKTSWGRCGEESTFTVTALRSVSIPARQVYTPRWAHTDDNHAWVEVFINGKWQYLGACEPEPELNMAWFDKPVKRAMMVHTRVFGKFLNSPDNIEENDLFTKINTLQEYTNTKTLTVMVLDKENKPVRDAKIEFGLYNYAEFYPIVIKNSDEKGCANIITGFGDLMLNAYKDDMYGYTKASAVTVDTVIVVLNRNASVEYSENIDIFPPKDVEIKEVSSDKKELNDKRLAKEDSIRNEYIETFIKTEKIQSICNELNLDFGRTKDIFEKSWGNYNEIELFLRNNYDNKFVLDFLETIAEKDLRDGSAATFTDHLKNTNLNTTLPLNVFKEGILNARIQNELIRPWRSFLKKIFNNEFAQNAAKDITVITKWINENIVLNSTDNYANCPISPIGSCNLKTTDNQGRNILFVAICRSLNIPARIDPATYKPQYYFANLWVNVNFDEDKKVRNQTAQITLLNDKSNSITPKYYSNFTIQKFNKGSLTSLDYEESDLFNSFPTTINVEPGYYALMVGNRTNDGDVMVSRTFFVVKDFENKTLNIKLRPLDTINKVVCNIDLDVKANFKDNKLTSLKDMANNGLVVVIIDPAKEPTRHVMADIPKLTDEFNNCGATFLFVLPADKQTTTFSVNNYKGLPQNSCFYVDFDNNISNTILKSCKSIEKNYPIVLYINKQGDVLFNSSGYRIGIGDNLLRIMKNKNKIVS